MGIIYYFIFVIAIGVSVGVGNGSLASAKTFEAGDASTSWIGTGVVHDLGDGEQVINAMINGVMIVRHFEDEDRETIHTAKLVCPVRVNLNTKNKQETILGLCTIIAHEGIDVSYAQLKCVGNLNECEGEFTFTGGSGGFSGISGTTPFYMRIIFEQLEAGKARAVGYAFWPNLTYTLP